MHHWLLRAPPTLSLYSPRMQLIPSRPLRYSFLAVTTTFILAALTGAALFSACGYLVSDPHRRVPRTPTRIDH